MAKKWWCETQESHTHKWHRKPSTEGPTQESQLYLPMWCPTAILCIPLSESLTAFLVSFIWFVINKYPLYLLNYLPISSQLRILSLLGFLSLLQKFLLGATQGAQHEGQLQGRQSNQVNSIKIIEPYPSWSIFGWMVSLEVPRLSSSIIGIAHNRGLGIGICVGTVCSSCLVITDITINKELVLQGNKWRTNEGKM